MRRQRIPDNWRCELCGRGKTEIGQHPLPVGQRAHLLPNRLTAAQPRYGGVKNPLSEAEWRSLVEALGPELHRAFGCSDDQLRARATHHCYLLCGECHEEVLSEPIYLPAVIEVLAKRFRGASRVQKIAVLTMMLRLGAESLALTDPSSSLAREVLKLDADEERCFAEEGLSRKHGQPY